MFHHTGAREVIVSPQTANGVQEVNRVAAKFNTTEVKSATNKNVIQVSVSRTTMHI